MIDMSLSSNIQFNMSKIGLIKESNESIGNIPLIPLNLSHILNDDGLEVHTNGSKITIAHDFLNKIIKLIVTNIAISIGYNKFSSHLRDYLDFFISNVLFTNK